MKSLVTGATGFLGSAVMRCLVAANHDVRVLVRPDSNRKNLENFPVEIVEGDLLDHTSLHRAVDGCDYLFHVAADYRLWVPDPEIMHKINVTGTEALILAAAEANLKRIVYTSSVAALGLLSDGSPANEETPSDYSAIRGNYKRSKYQAEQTVKQLTMKHQLPLIIVNPSTPIGPGDIRPTPTGRIVLDTLMGRMPAYVDTGLNIAHVDDIAEGHLLALRQGQFGQQYILGGDNLTLFQILQYIDEISGTSQNRINIPTNIMLPLAWCMEKIAVLTHREPRATVDSIHMAKKLMFFSSLKAERELGYRHRPAIEALRDAVKWFRDNEYCQ
ncbi:NAD-dependent epimerase/dehydratase family protein [Nitrosomonas sp. JL21]|uniref:hopanoid-associated sugar epimerase n=1 Tax=Nitrosomonas sp. JL21 TaxID=153949 RepID=UPI001367E1B3|nr:hopanoid-associated sugar epimerase [Nitrosomonas sp. JL21]MBL8498943.1 NAD-dependent epimerase/dehydratase family protein [Nitrosomonas sp.]MCC7091585.1 NAD-dependent epimerase/dehydratase family protein [Nitrosomonas sp.]MXS76727.1 NAD-dependent epimerase/dehydratase family protein [Nitrosomonas sp. JL21]